MNYSQASVNSIGNFLYNSVSNFYGYGMKTIKVEALPGFWQGFDLINGYNQTTNARHLDD
jgi:hypothetical protein